MNNIISFPQTAAFFLPQVGRCLPGLTDVVIELSAMVQRGEIEEELLKIKLKQKCFVALANLQAMEASIFCSSSNDGLGSSPLQSGASPATLEHRPVDPQLDDINNPVSRPVVALSLGEHNRFPGGRW